MAAPSFDELYASFTAEAQDRRSDLTFDEGDITEMYAFGGAAMADHVIAYLARRFKATFLDGAEGDDLTALCDDHWNIQRDVAVEAYGSVTITRAAATAGAGTIFAGTTVATDKDSLGREVQYVLDADQAWGALETGSKIVAVTCSVSGVSGNVAISKITRITTDLWDTTFTITNAQAIAGGSEEESDESLRQRARDFASTIRRATLAAIEYGAKEVAGVANATAVDGETGIVSVYVSDDTGASNSIMLSAVELELANWAAAGILVNVYGGTIYYQAIAVAVQARTGVDTQALVANIKLAIVAKVNKLKIGETLYHDQIKEAVTGVDPDGIASVTVSTPAIDLIPAATELIRTTAGMITVT
jgi:hypothetical protein